MCLAATVMYMTKSMLLWWTRNQAESCEGSSEMERRPQVQGYLNQTELTSELSLQCNYFALVERQFRSKYN